MTSFFKVDMLFFVRTNVFTEWHFEFYTFCNLHLQRFFNFHCVTYPDHMSLYTDAWLVQDRWTKGKWNTQHPIPLLLFYFIIFFYHTLCLLIFLYFWFYVLKLLYLVHPPEGLRIGQIWQINPQCRWRCISRLYTYRSNTHMFPNRYDVYYREIFYKVFCKIPKGLEVLYNLNLLLNL